jgi:MSHA biogenesis protein MshQ
MVRRRIMLAREELAKMTYEWIGAVYLRVKTTAAWLFCVAMWVSGPAMAVVTELNSTGGASSSNGLHFYIEDKSHIQVRRLNNTGQVYDNDQIPPHLRLDNGVFLRANGTTYGPSFALTNVQMTIPMYDSYSISAPNPANPAVLGVPQTATQNLSINSGPQMTIVWKYVLPYDFLTAEVTLTIPSSYLVSTSNPVRYYHVIDSYLGGSDEGCGVTFVDANGKRVVGTYPSANGITCPSSTSIPSNVSIVESFRERSGPAFSHYCTNLWSNFWGTASAPCAIRRSASLNDSVTTDYIDTGIGIEYDFTSPGTYTFSYDFVVGSPSVPPYDHIEIRHDGGNNLCPEAVTVLACSSSTVPCPTTNYVGSGTLTGSLATSPATPVVTDTPATFTLGSSAQTTTVTLQGTSPGGTYTLYANSLSSIPLNGTRCWNTSTNTASCTYTITNSPCVTAFECLETSLAYNNLTASPSARNSLYTKLSNTDFAFDVVALQSGGVKSTSYVSAGSVKVELFDDATAPSSCSAYSSPVASQTLSFATADGGRKTLPASFNLSRAYGKLRCRVSDANITPTVFGCSSDTFTVRPSAISAISSANATADASGSSASATPAIKAGSAFSLTANTGIAGYDGSPKANPALIEWFNAPSEGRASPGTGTLDGSTPGSPVFSAASAATGNGASGNFTYNDVGYFRFRENGVYDDTFASRSLDLANGDCVAGSFSNTLIGGRYGCNIGHSSPSVYFGRFIPYHFETTVTQGCAAGSYTYSGQPFPLSIVAKNLAGAATQNYAGSFAKTVTLAARDATDAASNPGPGTLSPSAAAANTFVAGTASLSPAYTFNTAQTVPTSVKLRASESEVSSLRSPASMSAEGSVLVRSGRARLSNAYGSEMLDLPMAFRTETWNGTGWVLNSADSCTGNAALGAANAVSVTLVPAPVGLPTCVIDSGHPGLSGVGCSTAQPLARRFKKGASASVGFAGDFNLWLKAPGAGNFGVATVGAAVPAWLGVVRPAVASFGKYKTPLIYRRENY